MELMLVLGLLVIVAAVSLPALGGTLEKQKLRSAAQQIQAVWNRTHVRSMKAGQIYVFRCELGGSKYEVIPWDAEITADDPQASSTMTSFGPATSESGDAAFTNSVPAVIDGELPDGIQFLEGDTAAEERAMAIESVMGNQTSRNIRWSRPVLFYSDGLSSDAYIVVGNSRKQEVKLTLRGMTGTSSVGDIVMGGGK